MIRCLYPHHVDPRDLGLYPWLKVLRGTERGFVCACCGVKQHPWRPMVFMPGVWPSVIPDPPPPRAVVRYTHRRSLPSGDFVPWCASCAWKLCGRQMVRRRGRRWWQFWR